VRFHRCQSPSILFLPTTSPRERGRVPCLLMASLMSCEQTWQCKGLLSCIVSAISTQCERWHGQAKDTGHSSRSEKSTLPPARFGMHHSASPSHPTQQASTCRMQRRAAPGHTQTASSKSYPAFGPDRTTAPGCLIPRFCPGTM
jgi:hypothetical protein